MEGRDMSYVRSELEDKMRRTPERGMMWWQWYSGWSEEKANRILAAPYCRLCMLEIYNGNPVKQKLMAS